MSGMPRLAGSCAPSCWQHVPRPLTQARWRLRRKPREFVRRLLHLETDRGLRTRPALAFKDADQFPRRGEMQYHAEASRGRMDAATVGRSGHAEIPRLFKSRSPIPAHGQVLCASPRFVSVLSCVSWTARILSDRLRQISAKIAIFLAWIATPVALVQVAYGTAARQFERPIGKPICRSATVFRGAEPVAARTILITL